MCRVSWGTAWKKLWCRVGCAGALRGISWGAAWNELGCRAGIEGMKECMPLEAGSWAWPCP